MYAIRSYYAEFAIAVWDAVATCQGGTAAVAGRVLVRATKDMARLVGDAYELINRRSGKCLDLERNNFV